MPRVHADSTGAAVYLHFHGGGMISAPGDERPATSTYASVGCVVSVDYRLALEHPTRPGPTTASRAAWLHRDARTEFGSARLLTGGEWTGGYMAAAVLLRIRDELHAATASTVRTSCTACTIGAGRRASAASDRVQ